MLHNLASYKNILHNLASCILILHTQIAFCILYSNLAFCISVASHFACSPLRTAGGGGPWRGGAAPCVEEAVAAAEWGSGALHVEEAEDAAAEWGSLAASPLLCSVAGGNEMRKKKGPAARGFIAGTPLVPVHGMNGD